VRGDALSEGDTEEVMDGGGDDEERCGGSELGI